MKTYTITLPDDAAHIIEVRAAIDNQRPEEGIANLLTHITQFWRTTPPGTRESDYDTHN